MEDGIYISLELDEKSQDNMYQWAKENNIEIIPKEKLHTTVVYSTKSINKWPGNKNIKPIEIDNSTYEIIKLGEILVIKYSNKKIENFWKYTQKLGATWDFPDYLPHVTVIYDAKDINETKLKTPEFNIIFDKIRTEKLEKDDS